MKVEHVLFAICFVAFCLFAVFNTQQNRAARQSFIEQWSTTMIGQVARTDLVDGDSGIIYINIDTIIGEKFDVSTYNGGPFYLLTSGKKAKLFEGGLHTIRNGDLVLLSEDGDFLVTRDGEKIIRNFVVLRDFKPIWDKVNQDMVKSYWEW